MIKQFLSDVCWGDLDFQHIDTPLSMTTNSIYKMLFSEACDIQMCGVQWPSG